MSQGKVKFFKNAAREEKTKHTPYVPQYQILGVEPEDYGSRTVSSGNSAMVNPGPVNPREKRSLIRQENLSSYKSVRRPQVQIIQPAVGKNLPNVGNNMDQTWSAIDGEILDDLSQDNQYLDNNDYVSDFALGIPSSNQEPSSEEVSTQEDFISITQEMQPQAYLLIASGVPVCSGALEEVQEQARLLVFGEHELCDGNPIPVEDLVILKKVLIKVGLFLE